MPFILIPFSLWRLVLFSYFLEWYGDVCASMFTDLRLYAAACMTWELAESGNDFITSVINGADLVPTFSAASVDDLRAEVTFSKLLRI